MQEGSPTPGVVPTAAPAPPPASTPPSAPQSSWHYSNDASVVSTPQPQSAPLQWTASEFIAHDKSIGWFLGLAIIASSVTVGIFLLTRDKITAITIIIASILFGVMAARKPREIAYAVSSQGLQVSAKLYPFSSFKSFSILQEGGIESVWFMPMKRFMPGLTIYFAPDNGEKIVEAIAQFLPMENRQADSIDRFMHRIRF